MKVWQFGVVGYDGPADADGERLPVDGADAVPATALVICSDPDLRVLVITGTNDAVVPSAGTVMVPVGLPVTVQVEPGLVSARRVGARDEVVQVSVSPPNRLLQSRSAAGSGMTGR